MELHNIHRIGPLLGYGLNTEEISGLEVAMLQRKLQEKLDGKMYFWGKIFGSTQDYLIVYHITPFEEFPDKKFYFWLVNECLIHYVEIIKYSLLKLAQRQIIPCVFYHIYLKTTLSKQKK